MIKNTNISGLICEFNPLHKGHKFILEKVKKNSAVICVMSGNFVQRGDFAIIDKWARTKMALEYGADLVLELPVPFATGNAETFSMGAIEILNSLGIVDQLYFGSECGDISKLKKIVSALKSDEYSILLKEKLNSGITFAKAREQTISEIVCDYDNELKGSNNNLAIEYLKALDYFGSTIEPKTITRKGLGHDEVGNSPIISAMQIREMINSGDFGIKDKLPKKSFSILNESIDKNQCPCLMSKLELAILYKLRTMSKSELSLIPDISEGIENKLFKAIKNSTSLNEVIELTKSKRYTHARIRRLILHAFLGIHKRHQQNQYIRILGMNETGKLIIKNAKKDLPIIGKSANVKKLSKDAQELFNLECLCDDIYELSRPTPKVCGSNQTHKIVN